MAQQNPRHVSVINIATQWVENFAKVYTGGPLLTLFFETLEKKTCKQRSDLVLNGQMRVPK